MLKRIPVTLSIAVWAFCGIIHAQKNYKGPAKHPAPAADIFPTGTIYEFDRPLTGPLQEKFDSSLTELFQKHAISALTVTLTIPGKGTWQRDTGFISRPNGRRVDASTLFYWASVGKLVTGIVIAQLIHEQKLSSADPLSRWYPQVSYANRITVDHLLTHTGGLYSFNSDSTFHYSARHYSPNELLAIAQAKDNLFKPGEYWSYSNTGYLLLALIAEKTEQKPFARIVQERISGPLGLTSLKTLAPQELPHNLALAHRNDSVVPQDYSLPLGAGNLVASSGDMAQFLCALLTGKIIPQTGVRSLFNDLYPMFDKGQYYGRGIMFYDFSDVDQSSNQWIGHSGGTENYRAVLAYDVRSQAIIAVAVNQQFPVEAVAYQWLKWVQENK